MQLKKTTRVFVTKQPDGTEKQLIRTFARDAEGTEYPVDKEIDVPVYKEVTLTVDVPLGVTPTLYTESWLLERCPKGTLVIATSDAVELIQIPDPEPVISGG